MSLHRTTLAGTELLSRDGDAALPFMLLHGVGSDAETWGGCMAALPRGVAAAAWDAPGYGGSAPVAPWAPTPDDYAARLLAVLDALGWARVVLAGHSLGCLFAARFALLHPARVAALALLSPALGYGVTPGAPLPPAVQARIDELEALGAEAFAAKRAPRLVHDARALPGVRRAMAAVNPGGYAQAVRALGAGALLADAAQLAMPALVAVGEQDAVAPPANAQAVHAALRHAAPLRLLAGTGHALPQERPAETAAMLAELHHGR